MVEEISGWEEVKRERNGSGCGGSGEAAETVWDARGECPKSGDRQSKY